MNYKKISNYVYSLALAIFISFMAWFLNVWLNVITESLSKEVHIIGYLWVIPFSFALYVAYKKVYLIRESNKFQDSKLSPLANLIIATITLVLLIGVLLYFAIDIHFNIVKSSPNFGKTINSYYLTGLELFFAFLLFIWKKKKT